MKKSIFALTAVVLLFSCGGGKMKNWQLAHLPDGYRNAHILSITARDGGILLGTYGRGALMSHDNGNNWSVFDTTMGLSWDFILGGDWDGS